MILNQLGLDNAVSTPETATDAELIDLVTAELGSDWPRLVAPVFDGRKAVLFDDRWASAREDLVKLWLMDEGEIDANWPQLSERFEGAGHVVGKQASWWQGKALAAGRNVHASLFGRAAAGAENPGKGRYSDEIAVVTGASKGSIAASVVAGLLDGGATVIATTSKLDDNRLAFYRNLYRDNARFGAALWVVPANMASYSDIDALVAVGRQRADRKPWAAVDSPQGRADADPAVPVRGAAGGRRPFGGRFALRDGDEGSAVGRAAADRRPVAHRLRARHRVAAARGAARFAEPRHVRRRRRLRRVQVRARRGRDAVERRVVVGAARQPGPRADRLDPRHRPDGRQRRDRQRRRGGGRHHLLDRADGGDAARSVQHRVEGGRRAGAAEGRPDRRARRHRHRHVRAGRQGPRGDGAAGRQPSRRPSRTAPSPRCRRRRVASPRRRRRRGTTSTSTPPTWW